MRLGGLGGPGRFGEEKNLHRFWESYLDFPVSQLVAYALY
jgi:hypothetical protein